MSVDTINDLFWCSCSLFPIFKAVTIEHLAGVLFFEIAIMIEMQFLFALLIHEALIDFLLACG